MGEHLDFGSWLPLRVVSGGARDFVWAVGYDVSREGGSAEWWVVERRDFTLKKCWLSGWRRVGGTVGTELLYRFGQNQLRSTVLAFRLVRGNMFPAGALATAQSDDARDLRGVLCRGAR